MLKRRVAWIVTVLCLGGQLSRPAVAQPEPQDLGSPALGVTYAGWRGGFADAETHLERLREIGFPIVTIVPAYAYVGLNRIDFATGPTADELQRALELALRKGFQVVVKPHLNPLIYAPGGEPFGGDNHSWRATCPWRGYFDVDPMARDYREGIALALMRIIGRALDAVGDTAAGPVRLELGVELMNSVVAQPQRWVSLLRRAQAERRRLGLQERLLLSHNFSHHLAIPQDLILRMNARGRRALAQYVRGLDALALSQYMDLTVAVPAEQRVQRPPTPAEVAAALRTHEQEFVNDILRGQLALTARQIPPLHIGEFGIGRGGLAHPNLYTGPELTPEGRAALDRQVATGHQGLLTYLQSPDRRFRSAVLWVTGPRYDVFGWGNQAYGVTAAAQAIRAALAPAAPPRPTEAP